MIRSLAAAALLVSLVPTSPRAEVDVHVQLGLPVAPPLVVVSPGVQVVENYEEEVFFTRGWYWMRRGPYWYRARGPRATFVMVEPRRVPAALVRMPPGHYKHWRKAEAKAHRREERAERKAWKEQAKAERHAGRGHGHGD